MDIFKAIRTGNVNAVKVFVKRGVDLNARDSYQMTPLIVAADERRADMVSILIQAGSDVNAKDKIGQTALHLAAGRNDLETAKLLIEAKADLKIKATVNGSTAYQFAMENGQHEVAELLKKAGAK